MARKDNLDFSAFTLGGTSYLGQLHQFDFDNKFQKVNTKGIADRYSKWRGTSRKNTIHCELMNKSGGVIQTNLEVALFSIGASALLGEMRSGKIRVTNNAREAKAIADLDSMPNLVGTDYEISGELMVSTNADLVRQAGASLVLADFLATVQITAGGVVFSAPMMVDGTGHQVHDEELQMYSVNMCANGAPTTPNSGATLFGISLASGQTAEIVLVALTGGNKYGNTTPIPAVITSAEIDFADNQVTKEVYTFEIEGPPDIVA